MTDLRALLESVDVVTVVGLSTRPWKSAHAIPRTVQACGYRVIPVHPSAEEILGERAHRTLADVAGEVGLVNVFRPADEAPDVVRQAIDAGAVGVWLQLGIASPEASALAQEAGIAYVEDRCLGVDLQRLGVRKC